MANFTTQADGNFATGATWVGGVAPGTTDRITLGHIVTISAPQTIANSSGNAVTINAGGKLIIQSTLTCNGTIQSQASNRLQIDIEAGGGIEFGNGGHTINTPSQYAGSTPWFRVRGTSGNRCFIRTASGGTNARFTGSVNYYGLIDAEYCDFTRIGSTGSNYCMAVSAGSDGSDGNASLFRLVNCNFDACGDINFATDIGAYAKVTIQNVKFTNSLATYNIYTRSYSNRTGLGVRLIDSCSFDKTPFFNAPRDLTVTNNTFEAGYGTSNPEDDGWAKFEDNLVILNGLITDPHMAGQTAKRNFYYYNNPSKTNAHPLEIGNYTQVSSYSFEGNILEGNFSDANGDIILSANATSAISVTLKNNIILPNAAGETTCTLLSMLGNSNCTVTLENNTVFLGTGGGVAAGETYAGHTGMLASCRGNLFWDTSARGYKLFDSGVNDTVSNLVTSANANYNGGYNYVAGSNLKGYNNLEFSAGSPGANDVDGDPEFVDATRDFLSFDVSLGGDGVIANAIGRFAAQTAGYTPSALVEWVKAGFAPTNAAYEGASFDGGDIGAVAYEEPAVELVGHGTKAINASTTSAETSFRAGGSYMQVLNASASTAFVRAAQASELDATDEDFPIPAGATALLPISSSHNRVAVILGSGTGKVYITTGSIYAAVCRT